MAAIERTAYPRLKKNLTPQELDEIYTPTAEEITFTQENASGNSQRLTLLVLLKCFQRLGYFPTLRDVPLQIVHHINFQLDLPVETPLNYDAATTLTRYRQAIRHHLSVQPYTQEVRKVIETIVYQAAQTMGDPADLINVAIEQLIHDHFELPAFSTFDRIVGHIRTQVHDEMYERIAGRLNPDDQERLEVLLQRQLQQTRTDFNRLTETPGPAMLKHIRLWESRLRWLESLVDVNRILHDIPAVKIKEFAAYARALEVGDIRDVTQNKRWSLLVCLICYAQREARDNLVEMFLKRMRGIRKSAKDKLTTIHEQHRSMSEGMVGTLAAIMQQAEHLENDAELGKEVRRLLTQHGGISVLSSNYEQLAAYHNNNYMPLMLDFYRSYRSALFDVTTTLNLQSTTQSDSLINALGFIQQHRHWRRDWLPDEVDLDFASARWVSLIRHKQQGEWMLDRRQLEICVFVHLAEELRTGDIYVVGSEQYADYRAQLLSWEECQPLLDEYCDALNLPKTASQFVAHLKEKLSQAGKVADAAFPEHGQLSFDAQGKAHLKKLKGRSQLEGAQELRDEIQSRIPERRLLDVLSNVQYWVNYSRHFGPPSGSDPKLSDAASRYIMTVFGFGCNLGAAQTAQHSRGFATARALMLTNQQHVTADKLDAAIRDIINEYSRFRLPYLWGTGKTAAADGTQFDLYENNLLGETHIRYGGYGGIAYHHISDTYIALFSHFIACGVWEAVYIIDGLLKNQSEIQPDTVHADTQGQSEPVFGLAHLLGIKLMPRIRRWQALEFYRPDKDEIYKHLDSLFDGVVNWSLIEEHWQDMLQVILSIQAGKVLPSMLLRKLGSYSRKNRLYLAFRELGRVVRTIFLLEYISNETLRRQITATTNKLESYNSFIKWLFFGGDGIITSDDPVEQEKRIKYNDLVANAIILQNVVDMTNILAQLSEEGYEVTQEMVGVLSPYLRRYIKRFGDYVLDLETVPEPLQPGMSFLTEL